MSWQVKTVSIHSVDSRCLGNIIIIDPGVTAELDPPAGLDARSRSASRYGPLSRIRQEFPFETARSAVSRYVFRIPGIYILFLVSNAAAF